MKTGLVAGDSFAADVCMESTSGFLLITAETSDPEVVYVETLRRTLCNSLAAAEVEGDLIELKKRCMDNWCEALRLLNRV